MNSPDPHENPQPKGMETEAFRDPPRVGLLYRLVAIVGVLFVVTILALAADIFGNPQAPVAVFLNRYGMALILGEVGLMIVLGIAAMRLDRTPPPPSRYAAEQTPADPQATHQPEE
ncbi:MAG: hypothetical protein U0903_16510 [Planctomycetales bacterium]